ncbi:MAG: RNA polymerase sigma factor [Mangrovibacterium sp.]
MDRIFEFKSLEKPFGTNAGHDSKIVEQFLSGDDTAYTWIYKTYAREIYLYGKSLGFDRGSLNDAIQDIFVKILCDRKLIEGVTNLKYYLFHALRNRMLNVSRDALKHGGNDISEATFPLKVTVLDQLIEEEERRALETRIQNLMNCLTARQREVISLRFKHEMSYGEIASLLNMSAPSVRNLVSRAIKRMRDENILLFQVLIFLHFN